VAQGESVHRGEVATVLTAGGASPAPTRVGGAGKKGVGVEGIGVGGGKVGGCRWKDWRPEGREIVGHSRVEA
jgi:hypothetical protein